MRALNVFNGISLLTCIHIKEEVSLVHCYCSLLRLFPEDIVQHTCSRKSCGSCSNGGNGGASRCPSRLRISGQSCGVHHTAGLAGLIAGGES